jgi:hypothetical protein
VLEDVRVVHGPQAESDAEVREREAFARLHGEAHSGEVEGPKTVTIGNEPEQKRKGDARYQTAASPLGAT